GFEREPLHQQGLQHQHHLSARSRPLGLPENDVSIPLDPWRATDNLKSRSQLGLISLADQHPQREVGDGQPPWLRKIDQGALRLGRRQANRRNLKGGSCGLRRENSQKQGNTHGASLYGYPAIARPSWKSSTDCRYLRIERRNALAAFFME